MKPVRILLPINSAGTTAACTEAAFGLAQRFGSTIEVLHPCPPASQRLPYATELSPIYFGPMNDVFRKQVDEEERLATDWFEEALGAHPDVNAGLLTVEGLVGPAVAQRAKVSDFTVLPSIAAKENGMFEPARDAALFHSGRPLLVMPDEAGPPIGETVVIAWKDAPEAVRAIAAAAPFLETAKRIRLVSLAEDDDEDDSASAMVAYLAMSGLPVELETAPLGTREVGDALLTAAGSGVLLVMGGYGHWRWREWVFGGATLYVLRNTDVAVLISH